MKLPLDVFKVRAFVTVARRGNFRAAADDLHLSQPAVSAAIRGLETDLDVGPLFERAGRKKRLSAAGAALLEVVSPVLADWMSLRDRLATDLDRSPRGTVRIGTGESAALYLLPPALARFRRAHPAIELVVRVQPREETWRMLRSRELDLAIRTEAGVPPDCEFAPLHASPRVVIAPKAVTLPRRPTLLDLSAHSFAVPPPGSVSRSLLEGAFAGIGESLGVGVEAGGWEVLKASVLAGLGIALVPTLCLSPAERRRMTVVPVGHLFPNERFGVVTRRRVALSPAAQLLASTIEGMSHFKT